MQNNNQNLKLQTRYNIWRAQVMIQERSIRVCEKKNVLQHKTRQDDQNETIAAISNLDREIQLEKAIEQRRALTNWTFRLGNDGPCDTPTKKSPFVYVTSRNKRIDAPFTKEMATDGRRHVLTRILKTDSAVQAIRHAARPRRGGILGRGYACLARKRPCHVKRFEGRRRR